MLVINVLLMVLSEGMIAKMRKSTIKTRHELQIPLAISNFNCGPDMDDSDTV